MDKAANKNISGYQFHYSHGIVGILVMAFLVIAGNNLIQRKLCTDVQIVGNEYSDSSIAYLLLSENIGDKIFSVKKDSLRNQMIKSDPWLKDVKLTRSISGVLKARILERQPVARVITSDGSDGGFISESGTLLPPRMPAYFDLPLLRNVNLRAEGTVKSRSTREFIDALSKAGPDLVALVSELSESSEGISIRTTPSYGKPSLLVKFGNKDFEERLTTMRTFWDQELRRLKTAKLEYLDLRFADQVIAKNRIEPTEQTSS